MLNYLVYKNGLGNFWSKLATEHSVLYVGFDGSFKQDPQPTLTDLGKAHGDLSHILFVTHPDNHDRFLLLTFERTVLRVWRVTGATRVATLEELATAANVRPLRRPDGYKPYFVAPAGQDAPSPLRVLPVSLVAEVPRAEMYTSVDSLAVYQSLNRGTCRPLWRSTGPTGAKLPASIIAQPPIPGCARGNLGKETRFAAFARLYLHELLHRRGALTSGSARLGHHATTLDSARAIVMATLNPILVETAALAFVQDLGLTPDIGVGKGMDVVDVRARAADAVGAFDRPLARTICDRLDRLGLPELELSEGVRRKLLTTGTLDIQCKAAERGHAAAEVLYFGFKGEVRAHHDLLLLDHLDELLATGAWPHLRRFIDMQARILLGEWKVGPRNLSPAGATHEN